MTIYMLQVATPAGSRYFDSFWATEKTAIQRRQQLLSMLESAGLISWNVNLLRAQVEDAALIEPKSEAGI